MKGHRRLVAGLVALGLALTAALSVQALRADAGAAATPAACSRCDARHARLQGQRPPASEVSE
jgi:hypothetical protein